MISSSALRIGILEFKLYLREPSAFFFTLIFPLLLMMLFGSIWGNDPFPGETFGYIDFSTASFIGIVILTTGVMNLTINISSYRDKGILRRFRATPISSLTFLMAESGALLVISIMGVILLLAAGFLVFGLQFRCVPLEFLAAFLLSSVALLGLGFIPASVSPSARSGSVIANSLFFPMLFLSGGAIPRQMLPSFLRAVSEVFPLTHAIRLMRNVWLGEHIGQNPVEVGVLVLTIATGAVFAARLFRWD